VPGSPINLVYVQQPPHESRVLHQLNFARAVRYTADVVRQPYSDSYGVTARYKFLILLLISLLLTFGRRIHEEIQKIRKTRKTTKWVQVISLCKLSWNETTLKRCINSEILWNEKLPSLSSPELWKIFPQVCKQLASWRIEGSRGFDRKDLSALILAFFTHDSLYAIARICYRPSVCTSVCLSVPSSVRQVDHRKMVEVRIMKFSPYGSPVSLVFAG